MNMEIEKLRLTLSDIREAWEIMRGFEKAQIDPKVPDHRRTAQQGCMYLKRSSEALDALISGNARQP